MKTRSMIIASSLIAILFGVPAFAQPAPGMGGTEPGTVQSSSPRDKIRDCSQTPNPTACQERREARAKLMETCKDKVGAERRQCMQDQRMASTDCGKAANPQQCEARKQAYEGCKGQPRAQMRECMQQKMPPADCSKAANPQRCEERQKVMEACKDKVGAEHRTCLREQAKRK